MLKHHSESRGGKDDRLARVGRRMERQHLSSGDKCCLVCKDETHPEMRETRQRCPIREVAPDVQKPPCGGFAARAAARGRCIRAYPRSGPLSLCTEEAPAGTVVQSNVVAGAAEGGGELQS